LPALSLHNRIINYAPSKFIQAYISIRRQSGLTDAEACFFVCRAQKTFLSVQIKFPAQQMAVFLRNKINLVSRKNYFPAYENKISCAGKKIACAGNRCFAAQQTGVFLRRKS